MPMPPPNTMCWPCTATATTTARCVVKLSKKRQRYKQFFFKGNNIFLSFLAQFHYVLDFCTFQLSEKTPWIRVRVTNGGSGKVLSPFTVLGEGTLAIRNSKEKGSSREHTQNVKNQNSMILAWSPQNFWWLKLISMKMNHTSLSKKVNSGGRLLAPQLQVVGPRSHQKCPKKMPLFGCLWGIFAAKSA